MSEEGLKSSTNAAPPQPDDFSERWSVTIPPELLRMIFTKLTDVTDYAGIKDSLLTSRLVHPRWRVIMDTLLQEKRLNTWKNCELSMDRLLVELPFNLSKLQLQRGSTSYSMDAEVVICPPRISKSTSNTNPFPSRSLVITTEHDPTFTQEWMPIHSFFREWGHHLNSLTLVGVQISPEKLGGILSNTPNLIALTFIRVYIAPSRREDRDCWLRNLVTSSSHLPPLPQLRHLRLLSTSMDSEGPNTDHNIYDWLLEPYKDHLLTLDGNILEWGAKHNFNSLKRFSTWGAKDLNLTLGPLIIPKLECLCLAQFSPFKDDNLHLMNLQMVQGQLAPFADSLVELHMDITRCGGTQKSILKYYSSPERPHSPAQVDDDDDKRWSRNNVIFSKLKVFSILYPNLEEEGTDTVKDMLRQMPNLETLNFLRIDETSNYPGLAGAGGKDKAKTEVEQERYWDGCQKLVKINVFENENVKIATFSRPLIIV